MKNKNYGIIYSSRTGNTKKLAEKIFEILPKEHCNYFGTMAEDSIDADTLYIGFWTDKGTADELSLELIKTLKNKKIFLFGTAGFGGSEAYFQQILSAVLQNLDGSNEVIGTFMCQGKMPPSVRTRYENMKEQKTSKLNVDALIENFDKALFHPDTEDLEQLKMAVLSCQ